MKNYLEVILPLALWCLTTLLLTSLTLSCDVVSNASATNQACHLNKTTTDNILPQQFATNVYNGQPKAWIGDWQGDDRPPLQAGVVLLESPITEHTNFSDYTYFIMAVFLQTMWVPAIWLIARFLRLKGYQIALVEILCFSSGFLFINSVFTWPKLLAGSLGVFALGLLLFEKPKLLLWVMAGLSMGLGLMSHEGVVFTIIPLMLLLIYRWRFLPPKKVWVSGLAIFLIIIVPWTIYQHYYDPPANRLLKWQLANVTVVDNNSFTYDLVHSYDKAGVSGVLYNKAENALTVVYGPGDEDYIFTQGFKQFISRLQDFEFRLTFFGIGLLNLGWLAFIVPRFKKYLLKSSINLVRLKYLLLLPLASLVVWVILMFGPETTIIQSDSYMTMLLLFGALASVIAIFPRKFVNILASFKVIYFFLVWIIAPYFYNYLSTPYIAWTMLFLILAGFCLKKISNYDLKPN